MEVYWTNVLTKDVAAGRVEGVKKALEKGANVDGGAAATKTPLHYAAQMGHEELAKLLCDHQANTDLKSHQDSGGTALHLASREGHTHLVKLLLNEGADLDLQDHTDRSSLHQAVEAGHKNVVEVLLKYNAFLQLKDQKGQTALHLAAECGHRDITTDLLDSGAEVNARDKSGRRPLHLAAAKGMSDVVRVLLEGGAARDATDTEGKSAMHHAATGGHTEALEALNDHGASLTHTTPDGSSLLHLAALNNHLEAVKWLVKHEAAILCRNKQLETPEQAARSKSHTRVANYLRTLRRLSERSERSETQDAGSQMSSTFSPLSDSTDAEGKHEDAVPANDDQNNAITWSMLTHDAQQNAASLNNYPENEITWSMLVANTQDDTMPTLRKENEVPRYDDGDASAPVCLPNGHEEAQQRTQTRVLQHTEGATTIPSSDSQQLLDNDGRITSHHEEQILVSTSAAAQDELRTIAPKCHQDELQLRTKTSNQVEQRAQTPTSDQDEKRSTTLTNEQNERTPITPTHDQDDDNDDDDDDDDGDELTLMSTEARDQQEEGRLVTPTNDEDYSSDSDASLPIEKKQEEYDLNSPKASNSYNTDKCRDKEEELPDISNYQEGEEDSPDSTICHKEREGLPDTSNYRGREDGLPDTTCSQHKSVPDHLEDQRSCIVEHEQSQEQRNILNFAGISREDLTQRLLVAAGEGELEEVTALVESGADMEGVSTTPGEKGVRPLHLACWGGHAAVVTFLLSQGANILVYGAGRQAVHWAAFGGHVEVLTLLTDRGVSLNDPTTNDGCSPLHLAADNGNSDSVFWLVDHGADIGRKNDDGYVAADLARFSGHKSLAKYLRSRQNELLLLDAAGSGHTSQLKRLIEKGVNVNTKCVTLEHLGWSALHLAADAGHLEVVQELIDAGAQPELRTSQDVMAVHLAAQAGHLDIVKLLLPSLSSLDLSVKGQHLVHWAALGGHVPVLQYLREAGFDMRSLTESRQTTLHLAADNGNLNAVDWLIQHGISINHQDSTGRKAEDCAEEEGHKAIVALLRNIADVRQAELVEAVCEGHEQEVATLVASGVDVESTSGPDGQRPIHWAAGSGHVDVLHLLLKAGAHVNSVDNKGNTVAHWAAKKGQLSILNLLKSLQCNISATNTHGETPLHLAAAGNHLQVITWLLDHGLDFEAKTNFGLTAEDLANNGGYYEAVELLQCSSVV